MANNASDRGTDARCQSGRRSIHYVAPWQLDAINGLGKQGHPQGVYILYLTMDFHFYKASFFFFFILIYTCKEPMNGIRTKTYS